MVIPSDEEALECRHVKKVSGKLLFQQNDFPSDQSMARHHVEQDF